MFLMGLEEPALDGLLVEEKKPPSVGLDQLPPRAPRRGAAEVEGDVGEGANWQVWDGDRLPHRPFEDPKIAQKGKQALGHASRRSLEPFTHRLALSRAAEELFLERAD